MSAKLKRPTPAESRAIDRAIAQDPDTRELSDLEFRQLRKPRGRPFSTQAHKIQTTIRFDAEVLAAFKATGSGWQTRMNQALRQYLQEHPQQL
jgi:uncharacterized protein (DUF4415 family)